MAAQSVHRCYNAWYDTAGTHASGQFCGKGAMVMANGDVFRGVFEDGRLLDGHLQYMNGSRCVA